MTVRQIFGEKGEFPGPLLAPQVVRREVHRASFTASTAGSGPPVTASVFTVHCRPSRKTATNTARWALAYQLQRRRWPRHTTTVVISGELHAAPAGRAHRSSYPLVALELS